MKGLISENLNAIREYFPEADTTENYVTRVLKKVREETSLQAHQIMLADSICCDDVNMIEYPKGAYQMLGPFKLGGLNGFPFSGITAMNALSHHVPEGGAVLIFYAPHIGITRTGKVGVVNRIGQESCSNCCGAAASALEKLQKGQIKENDTSDLDYQQNTIEQIFYRKKERILGSELPILEATRVMYEAIDERMNQLLGKTTFDCKYTLLLGGTYINGECDEGSFCQLERFDCIANETGITKSLL